MIKSLSNTALTGRWLLLIGAALILMVMPKAHAVEGLTGSYWHQGNPQGSTFPTGTPDLVRIDATVDFDPSAGRPSNFSKNNFVVRWLGSITVPESGDYTFNTRTDDGVRLWINGTLVINDWTKSANSKGSKDSLPKNNDSADINLVAGKQYQIKMEYFQATGDEVAQLSWIRPSSSNYEIIPSAALSTEIVAITEPSQGLLGSYWNQNSPPNSTFPTSTPDMTRLDYQVNFHWGQDMPDSTITTPQYAVSWTGSVLASQTADYYFSTQTNDGVKLWINGNLIIDDLDNSGSRNNISGVVSLVAGQYYEIRMEYMQDTGQAVAHLSWKKKYISQWQLIPNSQLFPPFDATPQLDWHLDEPSWDVTADEIIDQSGNNNHGTIVDIDIDGPSVGHVFTNSDGLICGAAQFTSDNLLNQFNSIDTGLILSDQGTIGFWYQPNTSAGTQQTLFDGNSSDIYFHLRREANGGLEFSFEDSLDNDFVFYSDPVIISANQWVYITASWDLGQKTVGLTLNGQPLTLTSNALDFSTSESTIGAVQSLYFGDNRSNYNVYLETTDRLETAYGQIDEVVIFEEVLTVDDIQAIYFNNLAGNNWDGSNRAACPNAVDHYRLALNDNQGLTCEAEPMALIACTNNDCSQRYQQQVSLTMAPLTGWSQTNPIVFTQQTSDLAFSKTTVGAASYALTSASPSAPLQCYIGATQVACETEFKAAGFRFLYQNSDTIGNQVAGVSFPQVLQVQAVEDNNGACEGLFTGNIAVELAQQSNAPTNISTLDLTIDGQAIAKNSGASVTSYSNVTLSFDPQSIATITTPIYQDAGQIQLHARYSSGALTLTGNSNLFWVQPDAFAITVGNQQLPHKAGADFDLTIAAVNAQNTVTENSQCF